MGLWEKLRKLFGVKPKRSAIFEGELTQADLRPGQAIKPEEMVRHVVSIAFPGGDLDAATIESFADRQHWKQLLIEDRAAATRDDAQMALDEINLTMLDSEVVVVFLPPAPCPRLPMEALPYTSVGFNEPFLDLAERCDQMLGFAVCAPNDAPVRIGWPLAHHLARLAARETGGLICDHLSERWWSLDRWADVIPYPGHGWMGDWIAIHDVDGDPGPANMHTHGMTHFGLPDLEFVGVSRFARGGAGKLMNTVCRSLILGTLTENKSVRVGEEIEVTVADVRAALKIPEEAELPDGKTTIRLVPGDPEAALVENRLLRILPGAAYGQQVEALAGCLNDLFPEEDKTRQVADDDAMEAAHRRAMELLPAERDRFRKGLRPGERLAIKGRFPYGDEGGNEYMWVEVQQWEGDGPEATIKGVLLNEPEYRPDLKLGQAIEINESAVYDWMRITPGGREVGNFTSAALQ